MKATLTIEVPDDFKKGDCMKCIYADNFFGGCKVKSLIKDLGSLNCPLEIQDEPEEDRCIGCIHRGVFNDIGRCLKCNNYNFYEQENNQ